MSEHLANFNARLQALVRQIMKEGDPLKYDELCAELWRVLDERERFSTIETTPAGSAHPITG
jgi:hypothetical protein